MDQLKLKRANILSEELKQIESILNHFIKENCAGEENFSANKTKAIEFIIDFFTMKNRLWEEEMKRQIACKCIESVYNNIFSIYREKQDEFNKL
jgi:hypothetical protein